MDKRAEQAGFLLEPCPQCLGAGRVAMLMAEPRHIALLAQHFPNDPVPVAHNVPCPRCGGAGEVCP